MAVYKARARRQAEQLVDQDLVPADGRRRATRAAVDRGCSKR